MTKTKTFGPEAAFEFLYMSKFCSLLHIFLAQIGYKRLGGREIWFTEKNRCMQIIRFYADNCGLRIAIHTSAHGKIERVKFAWKPDGTRTRNGEVVDGLLDGINGLLV
jgi:hypothetical protein